MDILRTPYGRDMCRYLNTRGKRAARRALMAEMRQTKAEIAEMLNRKFSGRTVNNTSVAEVTQAIGEWAAKKCAPVSVPVTRKDGTVYLIRLAA